MKITYSSVNFRIKQKCLNILKEKVINLIKAMTCRVKEVASAELKSIKNEKDTEGFKKA